MFKFRGLQFFHPKAVAVQPESKQVFKLRIMPGKSKGTDK